MDIKENWFFQRQFPPQNYKFYPKIIYKTKKNTILELEVGNLYCAEEILCGYKTIKELNYAKECYENHYAMIDIVPPILINHFDDFLVLEKSSNSDKTIIKFLTTNEEIGYSEYDNDYRIFFNCLDLHKERDPAK